MFQSPADLDLVQPLCDNLISIAQHTNDLAFYHTPHTCSILSRCIISLDFLQELIVIFIIQKNLPLFYCNLTPRNILLNIER